MFTVKLSGEPPGEPWRSADWEADPDWDFTSAAADSPDELYAIWDESVQRSRERASTPRSPTGDSTTSRTSVPGDGTHASLRRLLFDLVEEYGRHTGHADLLREAVDGLVGEDPPPLTRTLTRPIGTIARRTANHGPSRRRRTYWQVGRRVSSPVLVGRDAELTELTTALDRAAGGHGGLVLIEGDAGIGKSRLVDDFVTTGRVVGKPSRDGRMSAVRRRRPVRPVRAHPRRPRRRWGSRHGRSVSGRSLGPLPLLRLGDRSTGRPPPPNGRSWSSSRTSTGPTSPPVTCCCTWPPPCARRRSSSSPPADRRARRHRAVSRSRSASWRGQAGRALTLAPLADDRTATSSA